jgi:hypothetical protein
MISFRFHLVSIVAIFLALGLGVLTGTTVLNRGIVAQLERQTDQLASQSGELRRTVRDLEAETGVWRQFGEGIMSVVVGDRLEGTDVVVVTQQGSTPDALRGVRDSLEAAGASVVGEVVIDGRMSLRDQEDRSTLAEILGADSSLAQEELLLVAADRVANQLAFGSGGSDDVIQAMSEAGFLSEEREDREGSPVVLPDGRDAEGPVIVVVGGGGDNPSLDPSAFLVPLVERLVLDGQTVAASEGTSSEHEFVTVLRGGEVADRLVTQDNVDQTPGEVGLVLAIENLVEGGDAGHYGIKSGASDLLPELP